MTDTLSTEAELVRRRAADLAASLSRVARRSAGLGEERAILRLLGVDGLDRDDCPLAASVAELYCGSSPDRLARGVLLPFAVAQLEYDLSPRELALEVAAGTIDLAREAPLLERPDRLTPAHDRAAEMLGAAMARIDDNRTATREMREVLGHAPEPRLGHVLAAVEVDKAVAEIRAVVGDGADVVEVRVPSSREFAQARLRAGLDTPGRFEPESRRKGRLRPRLPVRRTEPVPALDDPVPAGSQRGLSQLRRAADRAAAERGCYASLMTFTSAFAAPEQAVVAALERVDYVEADPIREIVEDSVDPGRALADHAFAHRLHARAGSRVVIGPGPLALGVDLASGIPSDGDTRAGRALALQALGVELALADGLPAQAVLLGAVPDWVAADGDVTSVMVQSWLRHAVFAGHRLVVGPSPAGRPGSVWSPALMAALSAVGVVMVVVRQDFGQVGQSAAQLKGIAAAAAAVRSGLGEGSLRGEAADRGRRVLAVAAETLARLAGDGWASVLGPAVDDGRGDRLGQAAVVLRSDGPASSGPLLDRLI